MILVIDNYDSFTYNLVQFIEELGENCIVKRNDEISIEEIEQLQPDYILISPGPGIPEQAGISVEVIQQLGQNIPTLGVCLGHQAIAKAFGGEIKLAEQLMHGKASMIHHIQTPLFYGVPEDFLAGRYHSWIMDENTIPSNIEVIAKTAEGEIMAIRHKTYPIVGVQFHPESILTPEGKRILQNYLHEYSFYGKSA